jgi:hypothetical protein
MSSTHAVDGTQTEAASSRWGKAAKLPVACRAMPPPERRAMLGTMHHQVNQERPRSMPMIPRRASRPTRTAR